MLVKYQKYILTTQIIKIKLINSKTNKLFLRNSLHFSDPQSQIFIDQRTVTVFSNALNGILIGMNYTRRVDAKVQ